MKRISMIAALMGIALSGSVKAFEAESIDLDTIAYDKSKNGFELENKLDRPVWISVINGSTVVFDGKQVTKLSAFSSKDEVGAAIDIAKSTTLAIWSSKPQGSTIKQRSAIVGKFLAPTFDQNPDHIVTFAKGKTLYINLVKMNGSVEIVPQAPAFEGAVNKTGKGYSLDNNVTASEIKVSK